MMQELFQLRDQEVMLAETGPAITEAQIMQTFPEPFPGKESFVAFYLKYNGIWFRPSTLFFRSRLREVQKADYDRLEVGCFYFIPRFEGDDSDYLVSIVQVVDNLAQRRPDLRKFVATYLPIACDASGNEFWIELQTGEVKYRPLEGFVSKNDLVDVAPNFHDFVHNLEGWK